MLALALSINLTSYDGNTTNNDYINATETITMSSANSEDLNDILTNKSNVKL